MSFRPLSGSGWRFSDAGLARLIRLAEAVLMFGLGPATKVDVAAEVVDMRKGFRGIVRLWCASNLARTQADGCPGVWFLAFPEPPGVVAPGSAEISQLLCRKLPGVCRVSDRAGLLQDSHLSPWFMLPSASLNWRRRPGILISRLNG